jgi:hypothetical protein
MSMGVGMHVWLAEGHSKQSASVRALKIKSRICLTSPLLKKLFILGCLPKMLVK